MSKLQKKSRIGPRELFWICIGFAALVGWLTWETGSPTYLASGIGFIPKRKKKKKKEAKAGKKGAVDAKEDPARSRNIFSEA
ncbi:MAG: hypothetical protein AAFV07_11735, partial [Bacteroidota bacterium]